MVAISAYLISSFVISLYCKLAISEFQIRTGLTLTKQSTEQVKKLDTRNYGLACIIAGNILRFPATIVFESAFDVALLNYIKKYL